MEAPEMAPGGKAQCRWPQQLSRQELQHFNARRMRNANVCRKLPQRVWVAQRAPCRVCWPRALLAMCQNIRAQSDSQPCL